MRVGDVGLGQRQVAFDHVHRAVPEQTLQRIHIAAIAQVRDGKGVAQTVRRDVLDDLGPVAHRPQHLAQGVAFQRLVLRCLEERVIRPRVFALRHVLPD